MASNYYLKNGPFVSHVDEKFGIFYKKLKENTTFIYFRKFSKGLGESFCNCIFS
jgi:hypothetical protein